MNEKDLYYLNELFQLSGCQKDKQHLTKLTADLLKDVYNGYANSFIIESILEFCEINAKTWDAYLYAYKTFKEYQTESITDKQYASN